LFQTVDIYKCNSEGSILFASYPGQLTPELAFAGTTAMHAGEFVMFQGRHLMLEISEAIECGGDAGYGYASQIVG